MLQITYGCIVKLTAQSCLVAHINITILWFLANYLRKLRCDLHDVKISIEKLMFCKSFMQNLKKNTSGNNKKYIITFSTYDQRREKLVPKKLYK